ncbi:MAG: hypothetical protein ACFFD2_18695, partial [Promethearchaeota archaeon]
MKLFTLSFGTIEVIDGILIVDANLKYKTFQKEYNEILNQSDKAIKKLLKTAFEKGEITVGDPELEKLLIDTLEKLEIYDNPSPSFIESFQTTEKKSQPEISTPKPVTEPLGLKEPESIEELPIIEETLETEELPTEEPIDSEETIPDTMEEPIDAQIEDEADLLNAVDSQDPLSSIVIEGDIEEPAIIENTSISETEEIPISEIEAQSEGIVSGFLVQMSEEADFNLDHDNNIKKAKIDGKILLKNAGKQDRIWDINLKLDNIKSTSLKQDSFHINEIGPGKSWETKYEVINQNTLPIFFEERI